MKAIFQKSSPWAQLLIMLALVFLGVLVVGIIASVVGIMRGGFDSDNPDVLRDVQFISVIAIFILPAIACAWLFSDDANRYLSTRTPMKPGLTALAVLSMLVAWPFVSFTAIVGQSFPFPQWVVDMEEANKAAIELMFYVHKPWDLVYNIIIICVLTGIGEEFLFRGVLQNIFSRWIKNPHVVIWVVAAIFSFIHFAFYGFVARLLLGAWLGYLLYYTRSIWVSALAHAANNLIGVGIYPLIQDNPDLLKASDSFGAGDTWWAAVVGLALFAVTFNSIRKRRVIVEEDKIKI